MTTVAEAIAAAQNAKAQADAERTTAFAKALAQTNAPPIDINPVITQRVVEDSRNALGLRTQQVFLGNAPERHSLVSLVFVPREISGQQVYSMQVYTP